MRNCRMPLHVSVLLLFAFPLLAYGQIHDYPLEVSNTDPVITAVNGVPGTDAVTLTWLGPGQIQITSVALPAHFSETSCTTLNQNGSCQMNITYSPATETAPPVSGYIYINYTYSYNGEKGNQQSVIGVTGDAVLSGFVNPKYKIVGVMYAPPGSKSAVTYANNSVVGSSTTVTNSFATAVTKSVSVSGGVKIFGWTDTITGTYSDSYTQEEDSSSSIAVSQTTTSSSGLSGYSDPTSGVNHDYDYIFLWLNPLAMFTLYTDSTGKSNEVWTGYGYDLNDTKAAPDMDVIGVQLGCLNGDFYQQYVSQANPNWLTCEDVFNNNLSRGWALKNQDGTSPALTPTLASSSAPYNFCQQTGTDLYNVCQADPFANPNYSQEFPPPTGSYTTNDGRFTACHNSGCDTTIDYEPNVTKNYSQGYSTTLTASQGYKDTYQEGYSLENQFTNTAFSATLKVDLKNSVTWTWVDQFSQSTNSTTGQTASFTIVGPAEGYVGPLEFDVYQDNLYGTFMFYPGN
jgi:hypothetical protein